MSPNRTPIRDFTRAEAVYFLADAGRIAALHGYDVPTSAGSIVEALKTLGVSNQELRDAQRRGAAGDLSRWADIPFWNPPQS